MLEANIQKVSTSSYYEYGDANLVEIASGRLVITNDSTTNIDNIYLNATSDEYKVDNVGIILATENGAKLPNIVRRDAVNETAGKIVCTIQTNVDEEGKNPEKTEVVTIQGADKVAEKDNGYVNATDLAEMVFEAPNGCTDTGATPYIGKEVAVSSADKTAVVNEAKGTVVKVTYKEQVSMLSITDFRNKWNSGEFFDLSNPAYVELTGNINMKKIGNWGPIGTWEYPFFGTFDGNQFTIDNLSNHANAEANGEYTHVYSIGHSVGYGETYGFFGIVGGGDATFKDVTFTNVDIDVENGKDVGILVGYCPKNSYFVDSTFANGKWKNNTTIGTNDLTISNVIIGSSTDNSSIKAASHVGGIAGKIYSTGNITINNCTNYASVEHSSTSGYCAGIVGTIIITGSYTKKVSIDTCVNYGSISAKTDGVGGIVGIITMFNSSTNYCTFKSCTNNGSVETSDTRAGGILGETNGEPWIEFEDCSNSGNITSTKEKAGGIFGGDYGGGLHVVVLKGTISNTGAIKGSSSVSGIIGQIYSASMLQNNATRVTSTGTETVTEENGTHAKFWILSNNVV